MVSFTHGEGFGRPLLEATMTGLPVITSGWSGHIDFLNKDKSMLINGELEPVPKSMHWEDIIIPESKWFNINEAQARGALKHAFDNRYELKSRAKSLMYENNKKFTLNQMTKNLDKLMETHTKDLVSQVQLKLPKLKKIDNNKPKLPKIKLPKLNKVTEV